MIYMFLAEGFEEIEALGTLDILRRAKIDVCTVGVTSQKITGSHGITVVCDKTVCEINKEECSGVVLPGGLPGTTNLEKSEVVQNFIDFAAEKELPIAAICAAPSILGHKKLLEGKNATAFPGYENDLYGAEYTGLPAERDGMYITGKGAGAVFEFGFKIVEMLKGSETANELRSSMQCER